MREMGEERRRVRDGATTRRRRPLRALRPARCARGHGVPPLGAQVDPPGGREVRWPVSRKGSRELDGDERGRGCWGAREGGGRTRRTSSGLVWSMVGSGWPGSGARGRECVEPRTVSRLVVGSTSRPLCRSSRPRSAAKGHAQSSTPCSYPHQASSTATTTRRSRSQARSPSSSSSLSTSSSSSSCAPHRLRRPPPLGHRQALGRRTPGPARLTAPSALGPARSRCAPPLSLPHPPLSRSLAHSRSLRQPSRTGHSPQNSTPSTASTRSVSPSRARLGTASRSPRPRTPAEHHRRPPRRKVAPSRKGPQQPALQARRRPLLPRRRPRPPPRRLRGPRRPPAPPRPRQGPPVPRGRGRPRHHALAVHRRIGASPLPPLCREASPR